MRPLCIGKKTIWRIHLIEFCILNKLNCRTFSRKTRENNVHHSFNCKWNIFEFFLFIAAETGERNVIREKECHVIKKYLWTHSLAKRRGQSLKLNTEMEGKASRWDPHDEVNCWHPSMFNSANLCRDGPLLNASNPPSVTWINNIV